VTRLAKQWSDAFAVLPTARRLTHEQLSNALFALRADRLFAVTLADDALAVEAVLGEAKREAAQPRVAAKALGDATVDLSYTPINPCRILDTRATVAGPLAPNVARTFDGYSTNFAAQGGTGSGCGIPNGVAALAMNVYAVNPTNLGFIKVWPANGPEPDVSTVNYQPGITAIATGTLVPVDQANSNQFTAKSPATVDFIADVVGYFKPPGDATSLDIKVAGQRVMRYEHNAISPNVIGGNQINSVGAGAHGATISGGGGYDWGSLNLISSAYGTVGGGTDNRAGDIGAGPEDALAATVGGGRLNWATGRESVISGGWYNRAKGSWSAIVGGNINDASGVYSAVGGGSGNSASGLGGVVAGGRLNAAEGRDSSVGGGSDNFATADSATVAGGYDNTASGDLSSIGGGTLNTASGARSTVAGGSENVASGQQSTVAGGSGNTASGDFSFAAGRSAKTQSPGSLPTIHHGAFVFAGSAVATFHSSGLNEFAARTTGGVRFVTAIDGNGAPTWTCGVSGGAGGSWGCTSDRVGKTDLVALDGVATLERLAALPVYQWVAKDDPRRVPHAGPTAQDFMAAFGLGDNDKMIGFADAQGVLFAAVQGLNAKFAQVIQAKDAAIAAMKAESDAQKREIADLRRVVEALMAREVP
jgi:hypothetical protein